MSVLFCTFSRYNRVTVEFGKLYNSELLLAKTWFKCYEISQADVL